MHYNNITLTSIELRQCKLAKQQLEKQANDFKSNNEMIARLNLEKAAIQEEMQKTNLILSVGTKKNQSASKNAEDCMNFFNKLKVEYARRHQELREMSEILEREKEVRKIGKPKPFNFCLI